MRTRSFQTATLIVLAAGFLLACDVSSLMGVAAKPIIILQSPPNGSQFREGDEIVVQSAATDAVGIMSIDLIVDGAIVRTDTSANKQGEKLMAMTQKWKATLGTHTISVRAFNVSGIASDVAAVKISVMPSAALSISGTPEPPRTATPPGVPSSATVTPAPTPRGGTGRIAFVSNRDNNLEVYVMNVDGTQVTRLTNHADIDMNPAWSPEGTQIAYMSIRDGNEEIYVMNADGSQQINLTNHPNLDNSPTWSPDGKRIAFQSDREGRWNVYTMNANGSGVTRLTSNTQDDLFPAWSPDGTRIAFVSRRDGNDEIYVTNVDGTGPKRLTNNPGLDWYPAWSPDSKRIAYASERDGKFRLYVMNADGTQQTRLTNNPGNDYAPAWSPDGKLVVFEYEAPDLNQDIYIINADGTGQTRVTNQLGMDGFPVWQPKTSRPATIATPSTPTNIVFKFDSGVTTEQKEAVQKGIALANQYFGDVGALSVFAYTNLDTLVEESARYYKRSVDSEASKTTKERLQNYVWIAFAEKDAMWVWVSKAKIWKSENIQYAWQLMAHEYFHIVQSYLSKKSFGDQAPLWLSEGSAEYASYLVVAKAGLIDLKRLTGAKIERTRGILNLLSTMETLKGAEAEDTETPYSLGYVVGQFLAANHGEPALLKKYWEARATSVTWQDAFQTAFGISVNEFYRKFEDHRRAELAPYCGAVGEPTPSPFSVRFDRQFPPGTLDFRDFIYSQWSPDSTAYTFCVKGYPLATTTWDEISKILRYPKDYAKLDSCGGSCWILFMNANAPSGKYTFAAELPDGRKGEVTFQHGATSAAVVQPTSVPPTRISASPTPVLPPGIYVSAVQLDPPELKNGQYPAFNVTFINTIGYTAYYQWYVKIFEPDKKQSMGETAKANSTLPPGVSKQASAANWKAIGGTPCRQYIARVFFVAPDKTILEFPKPDGGNLWHYFTVCP